LPWGNNPKIKKNQFKNKGKNFTGKKSVNIKETSRKQLSVLRQVSLEHKTKTFVSMMNKLSAVSAKFTGLRTDGSK